MRRISSAGRALALGLAMSMAPLFVTEAGLASAKSGGGHFKGGVSHPAAAHASQLHARGHGAFRGWAGFGGFAPSASYFVPAFFGNGLPERYEPPVEPPHVVSCKRNQQTVTVPSESGGTRDVRVTRC
jgi:hypothetical protein